MDVLIEWIPLLAIGAMLGVFGGVFGIGGGIIAIPILVLAFPMDQLTAQGTAAAMMVPNLILAWWRYGRANPIGFSRQAAVAAALATVTTWITASMAQYVHQSLLQCLFALFLVALGIGRLLPARTRIRIATAPQRLIPLVGLAGGTCMGLLGVGGGLVAAPILTGIFGLTQRSAQSIGLALVTPSAIASLATYASHGRVDWPISIALAVGGLATVSFGVSVAHTVSEIALQRAFGVMAILMGIVVGFRATY